jgi:hypothetical protein
MDNDTTRPIFGLSDASYLPSSSGYLATRKLAAQNYMLAPGTVDLTKRQLIDFNPDNQDVNDPRIYGSEFSARDSLPNGHQIVYPTIYDGKMHEREEAYQHALDTGQHMGIFDRFTPSEYIDEYENALHSRPQFINGKRVTGDLWAQMKMRKKNDK